MNSPLYALTLSDLESPINLRILITSLSPHADIVLGLLDALAIDKCIVVGHSFGAMVGTILLEHSPERVQALLVSRAI